MTRALRSTAGEGLETLADLFQRCFEGYLVDLRMTADMLGEFVRIDHIDLLASRIAREREQDAALALIARRGSRARVAAMGVVAASRRQGVGRWLLERLIGESEERGDRSLQLEVIEQNLPAKALYERLGFVVTRRLVGFHADTVDQPEDAPDLEWIEPIEAARVMIEDHAPDPGWVLAPEGLAGVGLPSRAARLGPAVAVISNPEAPVIGLQGLYVPRSERRRGHATRLLRGLGARFPASKWRVRVVVPEGWSEGFFASLGFVPEQLTQLEMIRTS